MLNNLLKSTTEQVSNVVEGTVTNVVKKQVKKVRSKAENMVQDTIKTVNTDVNVPSLKVDDKEEKKDKVERIPALVSQYSKMKEKSNISASDHKKLQETYEKTFPDCLIRMKPDLYLQVNKKFKGKTVMFEDSRLDVLQKIPGQNPDLRQVIKYIKDKYTEETMGLKTLITDIVVKYDSPMNDLTIVSFNWSE